MYLLYYLNVYALENQNIEYFYSKHGLLSNGYRYTRKVVIFKGMFMCFLNTYRLLKEEVAAL